LLTACGDDASGPGSGPRVTITVAQGTCTGLVCASPTYELGVLKPYQPSGVSDYCISASVIGAPGTHQVSLDGSSYVEGDKVTLGALVYCGSRLCPDCYGVQSVTMHDEGTATITLQRPFAPCLPPILTSLPGAVCQ